ncbi:CdaR family transcriptional regulator [Streptomyces sp. GC420]|uniref:PucR family transcriptional regulator n=1 Tax=Streptomyces sp. GC420 TaxID=2697568 RepID=UPI001414CE39|nr:helix-turn-helix domain-containing protein [Streptomyces sp. GC420]NBM20637.1 PucR family transcriptional regulator [Streptomyces sp. GC420]
MARNGTGGDDRFADPALARVLEAVEASLHRVVADAVEAIWAQVPAYGRSSDERLREDVTYHVETVFRALLTSVRERRPAQPSDFPKTWSQARRRVRQGVSLADFLQAFRIGQLTLWDGIVAVTRGDADARDAAMALAGQVMHLIEVGSAVAAESYLDEQQFQLADSDRLRRDALEDLLARRDVTSGPKHALLRSAGLEPGARLVVISAVPVTPLTDDRLLRDAASSLRKAGARGTPGLTVVRQQEIVGLSPVPSGADEAVDRAGKAVAALERQGIRLAVGISTVRERLAEVPDAYAEACLAREGLGGQAGVVALPVLSCFDYLVLRDDPTARRLVRPELRRFIEEDVRREGVLVRTFLAYTACNLNAKTAAERLHLHVNTAYYRLERIAERTGCDLRSFGDVVELLIAVRLLAGPPGALGR